MSKTPQPTRSSSPSADPTMPTQRPFLASFLAAFRAHSTIPQGKASPPSTTQPTTSPSQPRTITTSSKTGATSAALTSLHSPRTHSTSPLSRSPGPEANTQTQGRFATRRGSDSSSEGFRDVLGKEKWYVGGKTAGEERFYKLGVIKRQKSGDRLSLDRLSL